MNLCFLNLTAWVILPMPTILRLRGLRIVVYATDHPPAHVHVIGATGEARINLCGSGGQPVIVNNSGLRKKELGRALEAIKSKQAIFIARWGELHGFREVDP